MPPPAEPFHAITELLCAGDVLVLTGAGISTDSGIPDYRGPSGRRRYTAPMTYQTFVGSAAARRRYWARSHVGWHLIGRARPNRGHVALAQAQELGLLSGLVTQNVDGLHTVAGNTDVIDLHGRLDAVICLQCGARRSRFEVALRLDAVNQGFRERMAGDDTVVRPDGDVVLPDDAVEQFRIVDCRRCGGILKPDVVFFGENVPRQRFARALGTLQRSRALLVIGSSLTVGSGYRFVTAAARLQLRIVILNQGATRGDLHATIKVDAPIADVLPAAVTVARDAVTPAGLRP